jgi:hypothetical protein
MFPRIPGCVEQCSKTQACRKRQFYLRARSPISPSRARVLAIRLDSERLSFETGVNVHLRGQVAHRLYLLVGSNERKQLYRETLSRFVLNIFPRPTNLVNQLPNQRCTDECQ